MAEIIILANSIRPGGRCIAGIDIKTGEWIRPVPRDPGRAIPDITSLQRVALLDIMEIPLTGDKPNPTDKYQKENWFVDSWDWKLVGSCQVKFIFKYCEDDKVILHSHNDRVDPSYLDTLLEDDWKSLQLIKTQAEFSRDSWESTRWRATFKDGSGHILSLKVTDPVIVERLSKDEKIGPHCLLTISLAGPWAPPAGSQPERCYKLVAGVIEL